MLCFQFISTHIFFTLYSALTLSLSNSVFFAALCAFVLLVLVCVCLSCCRRPARIPLVLTIPAAPPPFVALHSTCLSYVTYSNSGNESQLQVWDICLFTFCHCCCHVFMLFLRLCFFVISFSYFICFALLLLLFLLLLRLLHLRQAVCRH